MAESIHGRRRLPLLVGIAALLSVAVFFATQRGGASASATFASYPALSSDAPVGLQFVATLPDHPTESGTPVYPAAGLGPKWPEPSTIRKIPVSVPGVSLWIARTAEGGICAISSLAGSLGRGTSCTKSEEGLASGAGGSLSTASGGATLYAGVAPDGVSSVQEKMPDGSTVSIPVSDNGYAYVYHQPAGLPVASASKVRHLHSRKGHR
jgi:hypothetical protein